jgi:hypothetical protein
MIKEASFILEEEELSPATVGEKKRVETQTSVILADRGQCV